MQNIHYVFISLIMVMSFGCVQTSGNVQAHPSDTGHALSRQNLERQWHTTSFEPGYVYSIGQGRIQNQSGSSEQARLKAKRAAIDNGYANLLLEWRRVQNKAGDPEYQPIQATNGTHIREQGTLRFVEVVKERILSNGMYQVLMRMPYQDKATQTSQEAE